MEYYSAIKINETQMRPATWMNLGNIRLSDRSKTPKCHILYNSIYIEYPE